MTWLGIFHWYVTTCLFLGLTSATVARTKCSWRFAFCIAALIGLALPVIVIAGERFQRIARRAQFRRWAKDATR